MKVDPVCTEDAVKGIYPADARLSYKSRFNPGIGCYGRGIADAVDQVQCDGSFDPMGSLQFVAELLQRVK